MVKTMLLLFTRAFSPYKVLIKKFWTYRSVQKLLSLHYHDWFQVSWNRSIEFSSVGWFLTLYLIGKHNNWWRKPTKWTLNHTDGCFLFVLLSFISEIFFVLDKRKAFFIIPLGTHLTLALTWQRLIFLFLSF